MLKLPREPRPSGTLGSGVDVPDMPRAIVDEDRSVELASKAVDLLRT
jgi:hypothetical protein